MNTEPSASNSNDDNNQVLDENTKDSAGEEELDLELRLGWKDCSRRHDGAMERHKSVLYAISLFFFSFFPRKILQILPTTFFLLAWAVFHWLFHSIFFVL